jgi:hypothetical protein
VSTGHRCCSSSSYVTLTSQFCTILVLHDKIWCRSVFRALKSRKIPTTARHFTKLNPEPRKLTMFGSDGNVLVLKLTELVADASEGLVSYRVAKVLRTGFQSTDDSPH